MKFGVVDLDKKTWLKISKKTKNEYLDKYWVHIYTKNYD